MRQWLQVRRRAAGVIALVLLVSWQAIAFAQDVPPLKRMDGAMRARVLATIAGLVILGFGLVALAWLGARVTQRYRRGTSYFRPTPRPGEHDWARRPLVARDLAANDDEESSPQA